MNSTGIQRRIEQTWKWLEDGRLASAAGNSQQLVDRLWRTKRTPLNCSLRVQAYFVAGYTMDLWGNRHAANQYFDLLMRVARYMDDANFIAIALAHKGDLLRRSRSLDVAKLLLTEAYEKAQEQTRGYCAYLYARLASQLGEEEAFERLMNEACSLVKDEKPRQSVLRHYCLGAIYLLYCDHYSSSEGGINTIKALEYLILAECELPDTPHWNLALTASRGAVLVRSNNLEQGIEYVVEAVKRAKKCGNQRVLNSANALRGDLDRRATALRKASLRIGDALL